MRSINKLQIMTLVCLITLFISTPAFYAGATSSSANDDIQTKVTTNKNGNETTQTSSGYSNGQVGGSGGSGKSASTPATTGGTGSTGGTGTGSGSSSGSSDGDKKDADDVNYTGVYKGHQVLPDLMMIYCKVNAEDIIADVTKLEACIKKYVTAINNSNASVKSEGIHDFNTLRYKTLVDVMATAVTKLASVANYEETMNKHAEAAAKMKTNFETESVLIDTQEFSTDVMNSIRELYADILKYQAIDGMVNIDPSAILDDDEQVDENGNKVENGGSTSADQTSEKAQTSALAGSGEGGDEEVGGDGENEAIDGGTLPEVTVPGSSKLDKYENMSPEEFSNNKEEVDQLKKDLTDAMNDPNASDTEIANAQKALDRLGEIEEQKANWGGTDEFQEVPEGDNQASNEAAAPSQHDSDLSSAQNLSQDSYVNALNAYREILDNADSTEEQKKQAQYYIDVLNEAAPKVFNDKACSEMKRELGLSISCNDWK